MEIVNLSDKFARIDAFWSPRIVADVQNMQVKLARIKGEFVWHHHAEEDELFFVVKGRLLIQTREDTGVIRDFWLAEGEMLVIPRGVDHRPVAEDEVWIMLLEPAGTLNTGNVRSAHTQDDPERL